MLMTCKRRRRGRRKIEKNETEIRGEKNGVCEKIVAFSYYFDCYKCFFSFVFNC